nr:MAG TPA: hypothetical protein [Caudoviricetes sp.]
MKCNLPKSWNQLPKSEKELIQAELTKQLNHLVDKEEAEVQEIWIKLACILLHETFGFGEKRLGRFIAAWNRIYRRNERCRVKSEQTAWLEAEMAKCFPKFGFPQSRIDRLKERV